ncbi:MAG: uracil-DNA glycosylase [Actinomycetota bacterium]|nr:uracil-DNA glycosylase [Actinomycetota bacterium]
MADNLSELYEEIKDCMECPLGKTRTNLVFGYGSEKADLVFVGEAPGRNEDIQGRPFVGAAGKLLDKLLNTIGLRREDVYIANVLKCRPPDNRDPLPKEIERCKKYLFEQIRIISPKVICALGRFSAELLLEEPVSISKMHGRIFTKDGQKIFPIYHPAAALYQPNNLSALQADFFTLKSIISPKTKDSPAKTEVIAQKDEAEGSSEAEQMMLF